ncbi:hypothetical protein [Rhizobium bangladeshense]|uniref:hypothetical protein n=1 Tax=Rhizobium bangladeshense TaxID=1138189 RepID=UPI0007E58138|nr:hypothetical protein [Rhizobium bangladeshense]MBX4892200.1 hypothetical protein [Rhizobium bangladeshense]MBX4934596.1 hypothetical protein [Rhizobium bangladeshense]MBY3581787.1 hypothetical protein [Rhizobium bangladeshense]QSY90982.1 hypothetical protein J2J98_23690 [Rhizobium bangladeshense]
MIKDQSAAFGAERNRGNAGTSMPNEEEPTINPDLIRREGFASEAEYRAYFDTLGRDVSAPTEDRLGEPVRISEEHILESRLQELRGELENLRARLHGIRHQAATVVTENVRWADSSAHAQLGNQPWLKLAGAMAGAFVITRGLRQLPWGTVATTALPLVVAAMNRKFARR